VFRGYISAVVTPFKNGQVDFEAFEKYISWLSNSGVSGIVVCGSTGESLSLSIQEQADLIKAASKVISKKIKLIGGVICSSTDTCLKLMRNSEEYVDGFLCICPFYIKPSQEQIVSHFSKLNANTSKPIILYNNPKRVGTSIEKEAFDSLVRLENILAIKECSCDLSRFTLWRKGITKDFDFLTGNDDSAFGALAMGAVGVISVSANVCPQLCVSAYNSFMKGDMQRFSQLRDILATLHSLMFAEPSPAPAKYALSRLGLMSAEVREPLTPISVDLQKRIDEFLKRIGEIEICRSIKKSA
jgi:4-hydroxy-tetrahydrodipicolinate synthase